MARTLINAALVAAITPFASGAIYSDAQITPAAKLTELTGGTLAIGDKIQIGVVPAGSVLVPHLSAFNADTLDTGAGTLMFTLGTEADATAVCLIPKDGSNGVILHGSDFNPPGFAVIGDREEDVPIYLIATAAAGSISNTANIKFFPAFRAWRSGVDG